MSPCPDHRGPAVAFAVLFLIAVLVLGFGMRARAEVGSWMSADPPSRSVVPSAAAPPGRATVPAAPAGPPPAATRPGRRGGPGPGVRAGSGAASRPAHPGTGRAGSRAREEAAGRPDRAGWRPSFASAHRWRPPGVHAVGRLGPGVGGLLRQRPERPAGSDRPAAGLAGRLAPRH